MASSRSLLLLLLHLLVFAATAAAKISFPKKYVSLEHDYDEDFIEYIAKLGIRAYEYAQDPLARKPFLPQLINKRWIAVGVQLDLNTISLARRFCVIVEGDVFPEHFRLTAVARIRYLLEFFSSSAFGDINKRSIIVDKIEYHHV
ncbi:hypothetical protein AXF42_Ash019066 [Apostasia shenzhenica]|uniref:Uncharacterized protein n=1 Tax=Apostasia shenzhenica TaxID=1088818 RepID=A0A2I0BB71_9ASPA|nr:hypothetical protein AXF42_Ash019066 [Apostasia shenzhenica]